MNHPTEIQSAAKLPTLAPHQLRVMKEKADLDGARERLDRFLRSGRAERVDAAELARMRHQHTIMGLYSSILAQRIDAWPRVPAEPMEPQRDDMGEWWHPAFPWDDVPEETNAEPYINAWGYETHFVQVEDEDNSQELWDQIQEADGSFACWTPTKPDGDGWFLAAIYDTESCASALFVRPKTASPAKADSALPNAAELVKMVQDDIDICIGEHGKFYEFEELSSETIEAFRAYASAQKGGA